MFVFGLFPPFGFWFQVTFLGSSCLPSQTSLEQVYRAFSSTTDTAMPPIYNKPTVEKYDYIVLGGGSGGSGTAVSVEHLGI